MRLPSAALPSIALLAAAGLCPAQAQHLGARHFTVADGLGHNNIRAIRQDSRGYVWIGTYDGLTRFDGYTFTTYGTEHGLPHPIVNGLAEDHEGRLWVALFEGLVRVADGPQEHGFVVEQDGIPPESAQIGGVLVDRAGVVWCVGRDALYRGVRSSDGRTVFERARDVPQRFHHSSTLADRRGRLWFGLDSAVLAVGDGRFQLWPGPDSPRGSSHSSLTEDPAGRVFVASRDSLFELVDRPGSPGEWRRLPVDADRGESVYAILADGPGSLWIGSSRGLSHWDGRQPRRRVTIEGLTGSVTALVQDREGDLWIGTETSGLFVLPAERILSYDISSLRVVEGDGGRIFVTANDGVVEIADGRVLPVAGGTNAIARTARGRLIRDREGHWWFGGGGRLYRVRAAEPRADRAELVLANLTAPPGEWFGPVPYEDPQGTVWSTGPADSVFRVHRSGGTVERVEPVRIGSPDVRPGRLIGDGSGNLWISSHGYLIRRRADGRVERLAPQPGLPDIRARALLVDGRGWLWVGLRYNGVSVTRDPGADRPAWTNYSVAAGLSSNTVWALGEDDAGRIYIGGGRGLDRFDPRTGLIRHFSTRDGLVRGEPVAITKDSRGDLWISTGLGLSRLSAAAARRLPPPQAYFTRLRISGEESAVGERGATALDGYVLPASNNDLLVEFVAPSAGRALRYQYRLEGSDAEWSEPGLQRSVNLAHLASGSYRLLVRAIDDQGAVTAQPATLRFSVLRPLWQQWWFMAGGLGIAAAGAFGLHRMRLGKVLALERVRRQVAIDLHDDIGSGLAQIAVTSEVARRGAAGAAAAALGETAELARSMRSSMNDIVWAVDPRRDRLGDLVQRMREAGLALLAGDVRLDFSVRDEPRIAAIEIASDRRRHLLLMFKEILTNIVRHAGATEVRVAVRVAAGRLHLEVSDNGRGFDPAAPRAGHGLHGMRTRAAELRGDLVIGSTEQGGTTIRVAVPLA